MTTSFKQQVYKVVAQIPRNRVITYGQIAAICGHPRAARVVGGIAHNGPSDLPWHRVVKANGLLAEGFPGGVDGHRQLLEKESIEIDSNYRIKDFDKLLWQNIRI